ncbi:IS200/IS605 family transposase [Ferruginibacter sp. HRS2-29]|uniref:IS200/IS605 family transposase n=1 Tax=Ferruginibacter sp. HRS2-29 TaxID=2487334 RepID=UPI0020CF450D|nr:IS200/IS605 family transposase [Ferruginibacter sp. HRS2-29]MCP9751959.1 IS200/IS605 family transposase [Ferruginibacter sp. HRS2-29]
MGAFTQINYQIVFSTKFRNPTITHGFDKELYYYITKVLKEKNCKPLGVNGMPDHLHILTGLHPSVCLADLVKDIKLSTSDMMKGNPKFPLFDYWQSGYAAFTYSFNDVRRVFNYVKNQKRHHMGVNYYDELKAMLIANGIEFDEKYLL